MADDLLTRTVKEIDQRLAELRPVVEEHARLARARGALTNANGSDSTRKRTVRPARRRAGSRRARRGENRDLVVSALNKSSPQTAQQLAEVTGIKSTTLYTLLSRLARDGVLANAGRDGSARHQYGLTKQ